MLGARVLGTQELGAQGLDTQGLGAQVLGIQGWISSSTTAPVGFLSFFRVSQM